MSGVGGRTEFFDAGEDEEQNHWSFTIFHFSFRWGAESGSRTSLPKQIKKLHFAQRHSHFAQVTFTVTFTPVNDSAC